MRDKVEASTISSRWTSIKFTLVANRSKGWRLFGNWFEKSERSDFRAKFAPILLVNCMITTPEEEVTQFIGCLWKRAVCEINL